MVVHKPPPVDNGANQMTFQHGLKVFQNDDQQVIYLRNTADAKL